MRHLRYFAALSEQLSFTRAADKVHITQSTLSHQIKQLEDEIGLRLFDRLGKRVAMTEAGEMLLAHVNKALQEIDDGIRTVKGIADPLSGTVNIGATHTFGISLIPTCIAIFREMQPSISVVVTELALGGGRGALSAERLDLGVAYYPSRPQEFFFEPLYIEDMTLVVSKTHPLAHRKQHVRLAELHRQEMVLPLKDPATRQMLDHRFQAIGAEPIVVTEMNSVAGMISLVRRINIGAIKPCSWRPWRSTICR